MTSAVLNITFDCSDAPAIARFWAAVTGWMMRQRYFQPGQEEFSVGPAPGGDIRLYFVTVPDSRSSDFPHEVRLGSAAAEPSWLLDPRTVVRLRLAREQR
jgi:Glyoxalase-like domain